MNIVKLCFVIERWLNFMKKIKKIKLNIDYNSYKINEIIIFSDEKIEQYEAFCIVNSGIGVIVE